MIMQLTSSFERLSQIYREFVWKALIWAINLVDLKLLILLGAVLQMAYFDWSSASNCSFFSE